MIVGTCKVYLRADWANTLKEKRAVVKSLVERTRNKFHVAIAEVEDMDDHKSIVIGFACVTNETRHADSIIDNVLRYMENNTDAVVVDVEREIF